MSEVEVCFSRVKVYNALPLLPVYQRTSVRIDVRNEMEVGEAGAASLRCHGPAKSDGCDNECLNFIAPSEGYACEYCSHHKGRHSTGWVLFHYYFVSLKSSLHVLLLIFMCIVCLIYHFFYSRSPSYFPFSLTHTTRANHFRYHQKIYFSAQCGR